MTKRTLSNKSRVSILRLSGFRARMATAAGRKTIKNRRKFITWFEVFLVETQTTIGRCQES